MGLISAIGIAILQDILNKFMRIPLQTDGARIKSHGSYPDI